MPTKKLARAMQSKLNILMTSAEVAPFAKAGGLADVLGSLPPALKKEGCDVRIVMPKYGLIDEKKFDLKMIKNKIEILTNKNKEFVNIWQSKLPGTNVIVYFIENKKHFSRKEIYHGNNSERFLFFSVAILNILPIINFQPDVIHCHDYHTAMITDLLKVNTNPFFKFSKTLYTIHNINYQGQSDIEVLSTGNLSKNTLKTLSRDARDGDINFMAQGILNADLVNTVSKTYAKEITTSFYGKSMENLLRKRKKDLYGIVNGIDVNFFNPSTDKFIKQKYSHTTLSKKIRNKLLLQMEFGLEVNKNIPLVGLIGRLVWQKGLDLITDKFAKLGCQFIFLGTGHKTYENQLKKLAKKYPKKISSQIMFDLKLAQEIYAASDIFIMPSRYEPCGLGQMIAMRYGAVPVARATGGLDDTITPSFGFKFKNFTSEDLYNTLKNAINLYRTNPKKWQEMQKNGMKKDFSWNASAKEYVKLYKKLIKL